MTDMNRLTRLRPGNVGSLGFLPIEVCNNIYAYLLAELYPCKMEVYSIEAALEEGLGSFTHVPHSIDTAILRASRDVHREAYDLMVKESRFVHLKFQDFPLILLTRGGVPIVTANTEHVRQFKGYVLEVNMSYHGEPLPNLLSENGAFEAMILAENLGRLCQHLMIAHAIPGFCSQLTMSFNVGPMAIARRETRDYEELGSLERYFTEKTQKGLLQPLRDNLYGIRDVQICGLVSADLASSTLKDVASSKWGGPQDVLDHLTARKEIGMQLFKRNEHILASKSWAQDVIEIDLLRRGDDWSGLAQEAGEHFIHQVAETFFQLSLNCAHINLSAPDDPLLLEMAENFLIHARKAMTTGYWKLGLTWQPSEQLEAKLHFRTARFLRLNDNLSDAQLAIQEIDQALRLCPDDPAILRERHLCQSVSSRQS
ncbi:hypothetical protein INS49_013005 [Diaporthe citri]|uniref:uncharacterized protein n=1 Tax=Diaporthe citri TaxID=83186 RepID=UPI001C82506A|nr:uncharacterized protein INS49_013005 [Diaporthe citri]KAG6359484.1 hypothetical protein INS49_013005 [Diaporthe citri]